MPHADFVHLRVHSAYSLAEGAIQIKALAALCQSAAMPAVALTDSNNLFGALEFSEVMAGAGVQPIVGSALALARQGEPAANGAGHHGRRRPERLVLLAQDEAGYRNLMKLSSLAYLSTSGAEPPEIRLEHLERHNAGLLCLSGAAEGPIGALLLAGRDDEARALAETLARLFPGRLYVELQRHGTPAERQTEPAFLDLAYALELPLVASNDVFFADRAQHEAHDVLLCIEQGVAQTEPERWRVTPEHYFKSAEEMRALFDDLPEAVDNTLVVARRCAVRVPMQQPILPRFAVGDGRDEPSLMRDMAREGLEERLRAHVFAESMAEEAREAAAAPYRQGLEFELDVIADMGFAGYFLIVADFIQWAKREQIPVGPGRGSGAGSLVAWALKITDLDPIRFGLLFERFLNPERVSMPDFDIDFCQDKRDRVIHYVQQKYGHDQVAQIITFGKLQARAVLRDVGRVLGMPYGQVDRLSKLVPYNPANPVSLGQALEAEPRLEQERREDPLVRRLVDIARQLEGLYRHASTHAAGVVIGDRPLDQLVPLYRDPRSDMPVTQFNMKWVEPAGLVKFDFLGLKTLTVLDKAVRLINEGIAEPAARLDLATLPLDDGKTYAMLQRAEAVGIFQFESGGMRDLLREAVPTNIEDLIALVALYRPGPMENIPKYIACKHGRESPEFLHETIEPVVKDTYGVIIYQEQVMQIAQVFSGFTLGQADLLRRAMGKKIKAEMQAQKDSFIDGATGKGVDRERAAYVFDLVDKFAGYGFNKAHSAGYALLAYQTAYLKANHPVEFLAASMTLDQGNTDKLNIYRQELERLGIRLLPPDLNRSGVDFRPEETAEGPAIRYALSAIRNVGREAMRALEVERWQHGPFADLWDFARRMDHRQINKRQLENLARAGAFDSLLENRAQVLAAVDLLLRYANLAAAERDSQQASLFGDAAGAQPEPAPPLPLAPMWNQTEKLGHEFDAVGFYLSAHPLDAYRQVLAKSNVVSFAELKERMARGGSYFKLAGTVLGKRERNSQRGTRYAFVQLSDASGMYEVTAFAETLAANRDLLEPGRSVMLEVEAREDGETPRLTMQKVSDIEQVSAARGTDVRVFLRDESPLAGLKAILEQHRGGRSEVRFLLQIAPGREVEVALPGRYAIGREVRGALKAVPGVVDLQEV